MLELLDVDLLQIRRLLLILFLFDLFGLDYLFGDDLLGLWFIIIENWRLLAFFGGFLGELGFFVGAGFGNHCSKDRHIVFMLLFLFFVY